MKPIPALTDAETERFWSNVDKTSTCWLWTAGKFSGGYGCFAVRRDGKHRALKAHRVSVALLQGDPGPVLDHICRVRECVNPEHLRAVTERENILAGIGPSAINARKTHCPRGHEYTAENTVTNSRGCRECRTCRKQRALVTQRVRRAKAKR